MARNTPARKTRKNIAPFISKNSINIKMKKRIVGNGIALKQCLSLKISTFCSLNPDLDPNFAEKQTKHRKQTLLCSNKGKIIKKQNISDKLWINKV